MWDSCFVDYCTCMELSVNEDAGDSVRERLMLHWVNSLPLTKCWLVEGVRDLRYGDVLFEIVRWLQHNSADAGDGISEGDALDNDEIVGRLRRVVQFAATECRSQDEDAMYVVNDSTCLARVMSGESDAICAVLTVLKRLSDHCFQQHKSFESEKNKLRRREQEKIIGLALQRTHSPDELFKVDVEPKQKSKRVQTSSSQSRTRVNTNKGPKDNQKVDDCDQGTKPTKQFKKKPGTGAKRSLGKISTTATSTPVSIHKKIPDQTNAVHEDNGFQVCGMLDPNSPSDHFSDDARAVRFCNWARLVLQVEMPLKQIFDKQSGRLNSCSKIQDLFANGVLLRRVAAGIAHRFGHLLNQTSLNKEELSNKEFSAVNTPAGRRRNFLLALATFKNLGISSEALNSFESLQFRKKQNLHKTIWCPLDEILSRAEQLNRAAKSVNTVGVTCNAETLSVSGNHEKHATQRNHDEKRGVTSRKNPHSLQDIIKKPVRMEDDQTSSAPFKRNLPYITKEQMHVVNEWLISVGLDTEKVSGRGVLQDPMRNGVLLCAIQELKSAPFSYFKTPRTLSEMRENISQAFERLGEHVPPCYLTSSAEQSVLIGDRQIAYGVLWHLWQASRVLAQAREGVESSSGVIHDARNSEESEHGGKRLARVQPSALLLDIPAVALADDREASYQVKLHDSFARRLAWSEEGLAGNDDADDVFPVPKAPFSSPVYSDDVDIYPTKTDVKHQIEHDIVPTRSRRSGSIESKSGSIGSSSPNKKSEKISIGELSGHPSLTSAVVTPIAACPDSVELTWQDEGCEVRTSSPVKPLAQPNKNSLLLPERLEEILEWLKRLGIHLKNVSAFHDSSAKLTEFQSGVLLCCIVEKVEYMRNTPGITRPTAKQPLSKAGSLHNINKALNILQHKKTMPLHLLRRANAIYAGNRDVILQLLLQIRKAYGHHLRTPRRPKQQLSSAV